MRVKLRGGPSVARQLINQRRLLEVEELSIRIAEYVVPLKEYPSHQENVIDSCAIDVGENFEKNGGIL